MVKFRSQEIKDAQINMKDMVKSGYYEKGARKIDFMDYLLKWTKKQREIVT